MNTPEGLQESFVHLIEALSSINQKAKPEKIEQLKTLCSCLIEYNSHTNLVSDPSPELLVKRHILDSLSILEFEELLPPFKTSDNKEQKLIDLGSGAGFPGICLAIWFDHLSVCLVDSNKKKTKFIEQAIESLGLENRVQVKNSRIEELGKLAQFRGKFNLCTSRAFGQLFLNAELGLPLLKTGGSALFYKSEHQIEKELVHLNPIIQALGASKIEVLTPKIQTGQSNHVIAWIKKSGNSSKNYPRDWVQIKRQLDEIKQA